MDYQAMIRKLNDEREEQRRNTMLDHDNLMRNMEKAKRDKEELKRILD